MKRVLFMINKKVSFKKNIETVFVNRKNRNVTKNISFRCKIVLLIKIVLLMYTFIQSKKKKFKLFLGKNIILFLTTIPVGILLTRIINLKTILVR